MSTTTGPVTYPLDAHTLRIGMTVRLDPDPLLDDYRVIAAEPGPASDGQVKIMFTDGSFTELGRNLPVDVVIHAAMPGGDWMVMYHQLREAVAELVTGLDDRAHELTQGPDKTDAPGVRAGRAFEVQHCANALRELLSNGHG